MTSIESNSTIIDDVMYGETPNAKSENLSSEPPPRRFIIPKIPDVAKPCVNTSPLTPGIVMAAPIL